MQKQGSTSASRVADPPLWWQICLLLGLLALPGYWFLVFTLNRAVLSWPTIGGRVMSREIWDDDSSYFASYHFDVSYDYQADGRWLRGQSSIGPMSLKKAEDLVQALPPGSEVEVYVNPSDPQKSVLWPAARSQRALRTSRIFLGLWVLFSVGVLWAWVREHTQRAGSAPAAGG
jgi:hypothetical protein